MPVFQASGRSSLTTASAALFAFRGDTSQPSRVREIHLTNITAPTTSGAIGMVRSTALAVTPAGTFTARVRDANDTRTSNAQIETTWATAPTTGGTTTTLDRFSHSTALGNGVIWIFDPMDPLVVPLGSAATGSLVFLNLQATVAATYDVTVIFEV